LSDLKKADAWAPVIFFVIVFFLLGLTDWMDATKMIWAALAGLIAFLFMTSRFKEENPGHSGLRRLNFYNGLLLFAWLTLFLSGFLHWRQLTGLQTRMISLLILSTVYMVFLLRAMRVLQELKPEDK